MIGAGFIWTIGSCTISFLQEINNININKNWGNRIKVNGFFPSKIAKQS
jgi:hypothetical protein